MIRQDLIAYLRAVDALASLLTGANGVNIYLSRIPQGTKDNPLQNYPAIALHRMKGGHGHDLDGSDGHAAGVFAFHILGQDSVQVEAIGEQLRQALQGYQQRMMGSTSIQCTTLDDEVDDYLYSTEGDDIGFHRTVMIFTITYDETIPVFA